MEDVLLYLPAWTTKQKKNRSKVNAYMEDNEFKIFPEKEEGKDEYEDINIRKHISESEIIQTYHVTRSMAAQFLNRTKVPSTDICYNACIMWTAGILIEKYKFKQKSTLIDEAHTMIKPYFNYQFKVLNKHDKKQSHPQYDNKVSIKVIGEVLCPENIHMT